jgi:hypothetical protein
LAEKPTGDSRWLFVDIYSTLSYRFGPLLFAELVFVQSSLGPKFENVQTDSKEKESAELLVANIKTTHVYEL